MSNENDKRTNKKVLQDLVQHLTEQANEFERKYYALKREYDQLVQLMRDAGFIMPDDRKLVIDHFRHYGRLKEFLDLHPGYHGSDISRIKHGQNKFMTDKVRQVLEYVRNYDDAPPTKVKG